MTGGRSVPRVGWVEALQVREILEPANRPLVGLEIIETDDVQRHARQFDLLAPNESRFERHAVDRGQQVDAPGRLAELNDGVGGEVIGGQSE